MKLLSCIYALAVLSYVALPSIPAALAQASDRQDQLSPARQAIRWSQDRLSKFDAAIAGMEQDGNERQADARAKAGALAAIFRLAGAKA